jgi:molybdate transport system substrate-binding protein
VRLVPGVRLFLIVMAGCMPITSLAASAEVRPVRVAVAANFKPTLDRLAAEFSRQTGELPAVVSSGATGLLYSQVLQGAPFDVFFSADQERPARLEAEGLTVPGSRYTYAVGKLVLWRPGRPWTGTLEQALKSEEIRVVSIANPKVAPYGAAAQQVLEQLGLWRAPRFRIVQGESLGQAFQFVASGNAQAGFIALSQVVESAGSVQAPRPDEIMQIDQTLYTPLAQDVVQLKRSSDNPAAGRFLEFVRGPQGRAIIAQAGYAHLP